MHVPSYCFCHILAIFNKNNHNCQLSTIKIFKRGKIQNFLNHLFLPKLTLTEFNYLHMEALRTPPTIF